MFRMVVGTDGSPAAQAAVRSALALAQRVPEAEVVVVAAEGPEDISGLESVFKRKGGGPSDEPGLQGQAALDTARVLLSPLQRPKSFLLESGPPARTIARIAKEQQADLVVIGRTSRSRFLNTLLGSVSDRVLHLSPVPVMIAPPPKEDGRGMPPPSRADEAFRIVVATDGSEPAQRAVAFAGALARAVGRAQVAVLSVQELPRLGLPDTTGGGATATHLLIQGLEQAAEAALEQARQTLADVPDATFHTELGSAGEVVVRLAHQDGADVIVVGSSGKGRVASMVLGSVSKYVVHAAQVPVVVVRTPAGTPDEGSGSDAATAERSDS